MRGEELKNWLAILGLGGGVALGGVEAGKAIVGQAPAAPRHRPPQSERSRGALYVVINHEEQYSIWPAADALPKGWKRLHDEIDLAGAVRRFPRIGNQRFRVVINHEEQYSIWPVDRSLPKGYRSPPSIQGRQPCRIDECGRVLMELEEQGGGR